MGYTSAAPADCATLAIDGAWIASRSPRAITYLPFKSISASFERILFSPQASSACQSLRGLFLIVPAQQERESIRKRSHAAKEQAALGVEEYTVESSGHELLPCMAQKRYRGSNVTLGRRESWHAPRPNELIEFVRSDLLMMGCQRSEHAVIGLRHIAATLWQGQFRIVQFGCEAVDVGNAQAAFLQWAVYNGLRNFELRGAGVDCMATDAVQVYDRAGAIISAK